MPVDYLLARAQTRGTPLALCLVDLEKAFDTVLRQHLLDVLSNTYGVDACMLETICWVLVDTWGQVPGGEQPFRTTMGVKQGCPMSPLFFGLYFDRVVEYIKNHTSTPDAVKVAHLTLQAALYAGDIILMASSPSSLQTQLTYLVDFAGAEHLRVSKEKTLVLLENCTGKMQPEATELHEVKESKYLGII